MLGPSWKRHFGLKQFKTSHDRPVTFIVSQWQRDKSRANVYYCVYRVSVFLLFFVSWIFTYTKEPAKGRSRWPIYLTNWGFTLCVAQALFSCIMIIGTFWPGIQDKVLKLHSVYWLINVTATPVAFTISIIYWTLIFNAEKAPFTALNFIVHGMNSILMIVDLCVVAHPVRPLHFIYPLFLAFGYTIFTVIFYAAGGTTKTGSRYIYPILKWDQPWQTLAVCAGVMLLMIFLHLLTYFLYRLRRKLHDGCVKTTDDQQLTEKEAQNGYVNNAMANETV